MMQNKGHEISGAGLERYEVNSERGQRLHAQLRDNAFPYGEQAVKTTAT